MPEEKSSTSININYSQVKDFDGGIAGRDLTIIKGKNPDEAEKQLTPVEVVELISQIEALFRSSDLPEAEKEEALQYIATAKNAARKEQPKKEYVTASIGEAAEVLKKANDAFDSGKGLWDKLKPIAETLAPWLGIAAKSLLLL